MEGPQNPSPEFQLFGQIQYFIDEGRHIVLRGLGGKERVVQKLGVGGTRGHVFHCHKKAKLIKYLQ